MKIGKKEVIFYSDFTEMPIEKWQAFNKSLMYSLNVGSNISDFINHTNTISNFIKTDNKTKALKTVRNMELSVNNIFDNFNSTIKPFKYIIKSIDGKENFEKEYIELINDYNLTMNTVNNKIEVVKKKSKNKLLKLLNKIIQTLKITTILKNLKSYKEQKQLKKTLSTME